jgi:hypothetical protein
VNAASWERSKSVANLVGDLTVRVQRLENSVGSATLAAEVKELSQRLANLESDLEQMQHETLISRSLGQYGAQLVELLAQVVAVKMKPPPPSNQGSQG